MNYRYINLLSLPLTKLRDHKYHHKPPMLDTQYEPVHCDIVATDASNNFRYYRRHSFSYKHALARATSNSNMTTSIILGLWFLYQQILKYPQTQQSNGWGTRKRYKPNFAVISCNKSLHGALIALFSQLNHQRKLLGFT